MPTTLPASRLPLPNAYLAGVLISALIAFILEGMAGFGDARTASAPVLIGAITVITVLFWPVFALCLNNLVHRRAPRALGGVLHVGCMVSLTLTGVSGAVPASLLPGSLPAVLLALLVGWLTVEAIVMHSAQRRLARIRHPATVAGQASLA